MYHRTLKRTSSPHPATPHALTFRMNHVVLVLGALVLTSARHSSAQPLCGGEGDQIPNKVCLQILEEFLRKTHTHQPEGEYVQPDLYEGNFPFVDRGSKRQDVDHVFLRFGRRRR